MWVKTCAECEITTLPATATHAPSDGRALFRTGIIAVAAGAILAAVLGWMVDGAMWSFGTSVDKSDVRSPDIAEMVASVVGLVSLFSAFMAGCVVLISLGCRRWRAAAAWSVAALVLLVDTYLSSALWWAASPHP
jgi:hypothetical protein